MTPLAEGTLERLKRCSQGTLTTQLFKRGFRKQFLVGLTPLNPNVGRFAGPAFTLRFIPSREDKDFDLGDLFKRGADNLHWEAAETIGENEVLMIDARGDVSAATGGDILLTRMMRRGVAACVTDGAFRDGTAIAAMALPAFARANTATTRPAAHRAAGMQEPIGCAGVAVYPGDIVVGDADGVSVIPRHLADEIAADGVEQEDREAFVLQKIDAGAELWGTYPPTGALLEEYERTRGRP